MTRDFSFKSDKDIELEINEPSQLDFHCKNLKFTDIDNEKFTVEFTMDKDALQGTGVYDFSKLQRMIWHVGGSVFTFSKMREELEDQT